MKLIKFETINCTPCKMVDMMMNALGASVDEKISVLENPEAVDKYGIMKVPVLILVDDNGDEVTRLMDMSESKVVDILRQSGKIA